MSQELIKLNVGEPNTFFSELLETKSIPESKDSTNRVFIDRDGRLFHLILEYLRSKLLVGVDTLEGRRRLKEEAEFYKLKNLVKLIDDLDMKNGHITLSFRGKFTNSHVDNHTLDYTDIKFRKISRIMISGKVNLCREVFGESLNESRDPDHEVDKYTSRYFLKHFHLEQAYDTLACSVGTNFLQEQYNESDDRWLHYTEMVFERK